MLTGIMISIIMLFCFIHSSEKEPEKGKMIRSTSLQSITTKDDKITRFDYVDERGNITYAADKHYASIIETKKGDQVLTEFLDANGNPVKQSAGYYAILYTYNEKGQRIKNEYLGRNKEPVMVTTGYSIARNFYNEYNQLEKVLFFDTFEKPVNTSPFGYGYIKEYNNSGENISTTYIDANETPIITSQGFAIQHMEYYETGTEKGKSKYTMYYDEIGRPISLLLGQFGILNKYDELGRISAVTYVDPDRQPISTAKGYSTVVYTRYEDDTIRTEMFYDLAGKPVKLSEGQYGVLYDENGATFLDENGKKLFNVKMTLYNHETVVFLAALAFVIASTICGKKMNVVLLIASIITIIYMTLLYRSEIRPINGIRVFWTYKKFFTDENSRREIINNILLFVPLGVVLFKLAPRKIILIIPFVLSIMIEGIQFCTGIGFCEIDDIVSNSLGGMMGYLFGYLIKVVVSKSSHTSMRKKNQSCS